VQNVPAARRREIEEVLGRNIRNLTLVGADAPARFMLDVQGDNVRLLTAEGLQVVGVYPMGTGQWGAGMAQAIARLANATDLLGLDNLSAQLIVKVNIADRPALGTRGIAVVADTQPAQLHIRQRDEPRSRQNSLQLDIEVSADAFLTVVDIDSEGGVNLLFPNDSQQHEFHADGRVRAGERVLIPDSLQAGNRAGFYWDYSPPHGVDTLRVFASTDLATADTIRQRVRAMRQSLAQTQGAAARGIAQEVGDLRTALTRVATRDIVMASSPAAPASPSDWAATSLTVVVSDGP
jgi:hypothetical protein